MISKWHWLAAHLSRQLWLRASLFVVLGVGAALLSLVFDPFVPQALAEHISVETVVDILKIVASSMLAVTTFSLGVMLNAYTAVTSSATPRAAKLLTEDRTTQNVLATFIGSFLYSLVGIIALGANLDQGNAHVVLFLVTLFVLVLIVVALLRWISHLSSLGRVGETTRRVEEATRLALEQRLANPCLGCQLLAGDVPPQARGLLAGTIGYVQHIDTAALQEWADAHDATLYLTAPPGTLVHDTRPLGWLEADGPVDIEQATAAVRQAYTLADERTFEQDPRFGLAVLAEIASRALSPAINDSGTAIDVIGRQLRLLALRAWHDEQPDVNAPCSRLRLAPLDIPDLFNDAFRPIARDGAGLVEVQMRLVKGLQALASMGSEEFRAAARAHLDDIHERAMRALTHPGDRARLEAVFSRDEPKM